MNYKQLRFYVLIFLGMFACGLLALIAGAAFGFWQGLAEQVVAQPELEVVFVNQVIDEWYQVTGLPVGLRYLPNMSVEEYERITDSVIPPHDPQLEQEYSRKFLDMLKYDERFMQAGREATMAEFWLIHQNRQLIVVVYGITGTINGLQTIHFSLIRPENYSRILGNLPTGPQAIKFRIGARFDPTKFQNLHWRATTDPVLGDFYYQVGQLMSIWNARAVLPAYEDFIGRVRLASAENITRFQQIVRWWFTPSAILVLMFGCLGLWSTYQSFLDEKLTVQLMRLPPSARNGLKLPKFTEFLQTPALAALEHQFLLEIQARRQQLQEDAQLAAVRARRQRTVLAPRPLRPEDTLPVSPEQLLEGKLNRLLVLYQQKLGLVRIQSERDEIGDCYREAMAEADLVMRISKLKEVIKLANQKLRKQAGEALPHQVAAGEAVERPGPSRFVASYVTLLGRVNELFPGLEFLPQGLDQEMVKAIVLALLQPGSGKSRIGLYHIRKDNLARRVINHFKRLKKPFYPSSFAETLSWLVSEHVVLLYDKFGIARYSLCASPSDGASPAASQLTRCIVKLVKELKQSA